MTSECPGTTEPQGYQGDNDLYSCPQPGPIRGEKTCGWTLTMRVLCRSA